MTVLVCSIHSSTVCVQQLRLSSCPAVTTPVIKLNIIDINIINININIINISVNININVMGERLLI